MILENVHDLDLLIMLTKRGCPKIPGIWKAASECGNKEMLLWATENDVPWTTEHDQESCVAIARYGHLNTLQWAYQRGHEISNLFLNAAAQVGHFEMVKWLFSINAPRHEGLLGYASSHSFEMFMLCIENGCSLDITYYPSMDAPLIYSEAIRRRDVKLIQYLEKNVKWFLDIAASLAAIDGHFDMMYEFIKKGSELPSLDCVNLTKPGSLDVLNWLHEQGSECNESDFLNYILTACDLELLNWAAERQIYPRYKLKLYSYPEVDEQFRDTWNDLFAKYHLIFGA